MNRQGYGALTRPILVFALLASALYFTRRLETLVAPEYAVTVHRAVLLSLYLCGGWFASRLLDVFFWRGIVERRRGGPPPRLLVAVVRVLVLVAVTALIVNYVFQKPLTALLFSSGVLGIVLGFALRNVISDFFTGIALSGEGGFNLGEWIQVGDVTGAVSEMNWRAIHLVTLDQHLVVLPNTLVAERQFVNLDRPHRFFRSEMPIALEYSVPVEDAKRVLLAGVRAAEGVLDKPAPDVLLKEFGNDGIVYRLRFFVDRYNHLNQVADAVATSVSQHLWQAGMDVPYPKRDVFHARMPSRHTDRDKDRSKLLARVRLFESLDAGAIDDLAGKLEERRFTAGADLIRQGEGGSSLFIVVDGLLEVRAESDGRLKTIGQLVPGHFFGEMSLLTGEPRSATVSAVTDSTVYELDREAFAPVLEGRPGLAEILSSTLAARRDEMQETFAQVDAREVVTRRRTLATEILRRIRSVFRIR